MTDPIDAPRHPDTPTFPTPGIYLDMPEDIYHSIHACSASGLKQLSVSSMDYWANSPLNLEREETPERGDGKLTPRELGRAYHTFICEGVAKFNERYCIALDKAEERKHAEFHDRVFVSTVAEIRQAIDDAGGKPKGTAKDALIDQLLDFVPNAVVWDRAVTAYAKANHGKLFISDLLHRRICIADAMIKSDPQLKDAFTGGYAEVSIFWIDERTGVPCKARLDYLKMGHLIDLKSFSNKARKPIQRAIDMAISYEKYFLAVTFYIKAIEAAKEMVRKNRALCLNFNEPTAQGEIDAHKGWFWQWAHQPEPQCLWVFQQTGIAPVTRGRIMNVGSTVEVTHLAMNALMRKWRKCALTYGVDPWLDLEPVRITVDEELTFAATDYGDLSYEEELA